MSGFYITNKIIEVHKQKKENFLLARGNKLKSYKHKDVTILTSYYNSPNLFTQNNYLIVSDTCIVNYASTKLLELYQNYGEKMLLKLNGSFSFVVYDSEKNILFGARDRLGEKPFFYTINENGIECSSSLKSICVGNKFEIDETAKSMYKKFGYIFDSKCIFKNVNKLKAGHYFIYDLNTKKFKIEKYWDIDGTGFSVYSKIKDEKTIIEDINDILEDSIRLRMVEKCGIGISSGTDGFALFCYTNTLKASYPLYNIIPSLKNRYNEYPDALAHVQKINPEKEIKHKFLDEIELMNGVTNYFKFYDEPNSDFSEIITDSLFAFMSKDGIDNELSGIGSDDIFFAKPIYKKYFNDIKHYTNSYSEELKNTDSSPNTIYDFSNLLNDNDLLSLQKYNIKTYLPNLLIKEDIASTHNKINVKNPFCDYRLVEYLNTLDLQFLFKNNQFKYLLKSLILKNFGVDFFNVKKKGFFPDLKRIYNIKTIKEEIFDNLTKEKIMIFFPEINYENIQRYLKKYDRIETNKLFLNLYFYIKMLSNYEKNVF